MTSFMVDPFHIKDYGAADSQCGRIISINDKTDFVSGATNDEENNPVGRWPWMASLGYFDEIHKWQHQCGATLITDRHFLTAAHCVNIT
jgi:secreted trypsin-like serine protease